MRSLFDIAARIAERQHGRVTREQLVGGRGSHPVFPGKPGYAARVIESDDDVRDVIVLLRVNYDRAIDYYGLPEPA